MKTKKTNITFSLCDISNMLVQISRNINDNVYNHDDMLEKNLDDIQETLQKVYNELKKWV